MATTQQVEDAKLLMRAKSRVARARKAGREPNPSDIALTEEQETQYQSHPVAEQVLPPSSSQAQGKPSAPDMDLGLKDMPVNPKMVDRKPSGAREKSWNDFFQNRFGPFVVIIIWFFTTDIDKASFLAPSPEEMRTAALPLAKIASRVESWFSVPAWAHDVMVSTDDVVTLGMVTMSYLDRIGYLEKIAPYFMGTAAKMRKMQNEKAKPSGSTQPVYPSQNGHGNFDIDPGIYQQIGGQWKAEG
jgi:hypothetical protein